MTRKIVVYSYAMVAATLALAPHAGLALHRRRRGAGRAVPARVPPPARPGPRGARALPMRLFHFSIAYLTLLFVAVAVTALLPFGRW